jgi:hypothetical protein
LLITCYIQKFTSEKITSEIGKQGA